MLIDADIMEQHLNNILAELNLKSNCQLQDLKDQKREVMVENYEKVVEFSSESALQAKNNHSFKPC